MVLSFQKYNVHFLDILLPFLFCFLFSLEEATWPRRKHREEAGNEVILGSDLDSVM